MVWPAFRENKKLIFLYKKKTNKTKNKIKNQTTMGILIHILKVNLESPGFSSFERGERDGYRLELIWDDPLVFIMTPVSQNVSSK